MRGVRAGVEYDPHSIELPERLAYLKTGNTITNEGAWKTDLHSDMPSRRMEIVVAAVG